MTLGLILWVIVETLPTDALMDRIVFRIAQLLAGCALDITVTGPICAWYTRRWHVRWAH